MARSTLLSSASFAAASPLRLALEELALVHKTDAALESWEDRWTPQPWRLFDTEGVAVRSETALAEGGLFLLFEGGQWIWPGVRPGFKRELAIHDRAVVMETLELEPLILQVDGFLAPTEATAVINAAAPNVRPSGVTMNDADRKAGKKNSDFRTSETHWLHTRCVSIIWKVSTVQKMQRVLTWRIGGCCVDWAQGAVD